MKKTIKDAANIIEDEAEKSQQELNLILANRKFHPKQEFVMCFPEELSSIIDTAGLNLTDVKVLVRYTKYMEYGNQISISQQDIADDLKMQRSNVSRSVAHLVKAGIFQRKGRSLFMNPEIFVKGRLDNLKPHAKK